MGLLPYASIVSNMRPSPTPLVSPTAAKVSTTQCRDCSHDKLFVLIPGLVAFPYHRSTARRQQSSSISEAKPRSCVV
ncbi:putative 4-aminobutyrate aminotransferase, mitochondrial isoform [Sesbania bispinosa]|nr:putative 4-aminobutyrate aminotransferase, mitochondrial isoform [Sesbania bispinosa]